MHEEVNKIAAMMIKDCRLMIGLHRITMAQKLEKKKCKSEILSKVNINFDDYTNEKKQSIIQNGHLFQNIHAKYLL